MSNGDMYQSNIKCVIKSNVDAICLTDALTNSLHVNLRQSRWNLHDPQEKIAIVKFPKAEQKLTLAVNISLFQVQYHNY